ncbi:hypothetical protein ACFQ3W_19215 [Paenibacillus puldeungensis]|uniref:Uncharacterized protein n=1 Tax=Paenibacillus puldeungensis TaxID=696536 RepID=A0ABW3S1U1_9BACL
MGKESLLEILFDPTSSDAEKDDAVIELGSSYQDDETVDILIKVSNDRNYDEMIDASCGESIAQIWLIHQRIDFKRLASLKGITLIEALSLIKAKRPDWYSTYLVSLVSRAAPEVNIKTRKKPYRSRLFVGFIFFFLHLLINAFPTSTKGGFTR